MDSCNMNPSFFLIVNFGEQYDSSNRFCNWDYERDASRR
jgi:hypothetical protein